MSIRGRLLDIVGKENVSESSDVLSRFSQDFSQLAPRSPDFVVMPKSAQQVKEIIIAANESKTPVVASSSSVHFYGATLPKQGGMILDLCALDRILEIDELNRKVRIEAGVTWAKLTTELRSRGFRIIMPLLPHSGRSVVTDFLEREVPTNVVYDYGEPLQGMEVIWPTGEMFRTGSASVTGYPDSTSKGGNPSGPGLDFYRLLQGSQGTMGIVTWANLKMESIPKIDKVLFISSNEISNLINLLYRVLPRRIGQECLLLNNANLALILAEANSDYEKMIKRLPIWTVILVISGLHRRPEEKIFYEMKTLQEILKNEFSQLVMSEGLPDFPGVGNRLLHLLRNPWPESVSYWKTRYKGSFRSLFFITKPILAEMFISSLFEMASKHDVARKWIGIYVQPIEHNRACQVEFNLFYDPDKTDDTERVNKLYCEAGLEFLSKGALFTRPYGELSKHVFRHCGEYTNTVRRVKRIFDPNDIMNPGTLCF